LLVGSVLLGAGIGTMHYTGMAPTASMAWCATTRRCSQCPWSGGRAAGPSWRCGYAAGCATTCQRRWLALLSALRDGQRGVRHALHGHGRRPISSATAARTLPIPDFPRASWRSGVGIVTTLLIGLVSSVAEPGLAQRDWRAGCTAASSDPRRILDTHRKAF